MVQNLDAWRISAYDTPVRNIPSRRAGRFNAAGDPPTQYLCLHPWGPWAEMLRWEDRRTPHDATALQTRVWALRVRIDGPVQRVTFDNAPLHGLTADDLVSESYAACQQLGRTMRASGVSALIVPSAALPGAENLVVLGPRVMTAWLVDPVDEVDVPAAVAADRAGAPLAVLPHVRWRSASHAALDAWGAGHPFRFHEPVPTPMA